MPAQMRKRNNPIIYESRKRSNRNNFHIHESVLELILCRLPVKSLLRFRCVCKSWCALITNRIKSTEFVSMHQTHSSTYLLLVSSVVDNASLIHSSSVRRPPKSPSHTESQNSCGPCFFIMETVDGRMRRKGFHSLISLATDKDLTATRQDLPTSHIIDPCAYNNVEACGPCNGIFCISSGVDKVALWNPATRESKRLPPSQISRLPLQLFPSKFQKGSQVGFGFDAKTNDYKVLQTLMLHTGHFQFELYSLRDDSWKKLTPTVNGPDSSNKFGPSSISFENNVNVCWLAKRDIIVWEIILFDVSDEKFEIIGLPSEMSSLAAFEKGRLFTFGESIALAFYNPVVGCDIWVSNSGGDKFSSWTKLYSARGRQKMYFGCSLYPIVFCEDGKIVFQNLSNGRDHYLYDPCTEELEYLREFVVSTSRAFTFKESLIALS